MSLSSEILNYTDGDGLVSNQVTNGVFRTSDNGPLLTSEYIILLQKRKEMFLSDKQQFQKVIESCIGPDNLLHRAPGDVTSDSVDDHYGVFGAYVFLDLVPTFSLSVKLWYQPQLFFAWKCAQQKVKWWKPYYWPLEAFSALIIATSCIGVNPSNSDARKLAYMLIQATQCSLLCRLASNIWFKRLLSTYPGGMSDVYKLWYTDQNHTIPKYAILK